MRVIISSPERAKALAKSLRALLKDEGVTVRLGEAQAILASMLGYDAWAELRLVTGRKDDAPSAFDGDPGIAGERRSFQASRLAAACGSRLAASAADWIVGELGACAPPSLRAKPNAGPAILRAGRMTPSEWMATNRIRPGDAGNARLRDVLARQLGSPWEGIDALPRHSRILATAFGLFLVAHRSVGGTLVECQDMAETTRDPALAAGVDAMVTDHLSDPVLRAVIESVASGHAYVTTALCGLLSAARKRAGVIAGAEILWVKAHDRALHHALQDVGRRACTIEGIGVAGHLAAERRAGTPLHDIVIDGAVGGIETYLAEGSPEPAGRFPLPVRIAIPTGPIPSPSA